MSEKSLSGDIDFVYFSLILELVPAGRWLEVDNSAIIFTTTQLILSLLPPGTYTHVELRGNLMW